MYINVLSGLPIQILSCFSISIGTLAFGLSFLWVAPAVPKLLANNGNFSDNTPVRISEDEGSWIASIQLMTLPIMSLSTIFLANSFGTKNILIIGPIPIIVSWLLVYFAQNVWYFYIARGLISISEAFYYNCGPVYICEISDPKIRGAMLFLLPVMMNTGGLIAYYFGYILSIRKFALISLIPAILNFISFVFMPNSPYFLIIRKKYDEAESTLKFLRGKSYVDGEMQVLKEAIEKEMSDKINVEKLLSTYSYRISFGIVLMLMSFQQLCGSTAVATYLHYIINESNVNIDTGTIALVVGFITVLGSLFSTIWIDRKGRRPLLLISISASCLLMFLLGMWFTFKENQWDLSDYDWILFIILASYLFFVNFGIVNMSVVLAGELFSTNTKNFGVSIASIGFGVFGFVTTKIFLFISIKFGISYNFYGFSIFSFFGVVLLYLYLPETRQKTLQEIQEILQNRNIKNSIK